VLDCVSYERPLLPPSLSLPSRPPFPPSLPPCPPSLLTWAMHHLPGRVLEEVHRGGIGPGGRRGLCLSLGLDEVEEEGVKEEGEEKEEAWLQHSKERSSRGPGKRLPLCRLCSWCLPLVALCVVCRCVDMQVDMCISTSRDGSPQLVRLLAKRCCCERCMACRLGS